MMSEESAEKTIPAGKTEADFRDGESQGEPTRDSDQDSLENTKRALESLDVTELVRLGGEIAEQGKWGFSERRNLASQYRNLAGTLANEKRTTDALNLCRTSLLLSPASPVTARLALRIACSRLYFREALEFALPYVDYLKEDDFYFLLCASLHCKDGDGSVERGITKTIAPFLYAFDGKPVAPVEDKPPGNRCASPAWRPIRIGLLSAHFNEYLFQYRGVFKLFLQLSVEPRFRFFFYNESAFSDSVSVNFMEFGKVRLTHALDVAEASTVIKQDGLDILISLDSFSLGLRSGILTRRPAEKILSWMNVFSSSLSPLIDYVIADEENLPLPERAQWSETVISAPQLIWALDAAKMPNFKPDMPSGVAKPVTLGFSGHHGKICNATLRAWRRIFHEIPASEAEFIIPSSFLGDGADGDQRFFDRIDRAGIPRDRIRIVACRPFNALPVFLREVARIDIALDALNFSGFQTVMNNLWYGVTPVTLYGGRWQSRMAASVLKTLGLDELVAHNVDEYVDKVIGLVRDRARLDEYRATLRNRLRASHFLDLPGQARLLGDSLEQIARDGDRSPAMPALKVPRPETTGTSPGNVLHVGCGITDLSGRKPFDDRTKWREIRLDAHPRGRPDLLGDLSDLREIADASVDAVFSSHVIEHVSTYDATRGLREFHRVLKPDGFVVVICPDLFAAAEQITAGREMEPVYTRNGVSITPLDLIYGWWRLTYDNTYERHRHGYSHQDLARALRKAGFAYADARGYNYDLYAIGHHLPDQQDFCHSILRQLGAFGNIE